MTGDAPRASLRWRLKTAASALPSGPVPPGSSLEWILGWGAAHLGVTVPLAADAEWPPGTVQVAVAAPKWRRFRVAALSGTVGVKDLLSVTATFQATVGGCFRARTWPALELFLRQLAAAARVPPHGHRAYVSVSQLANAIVWFAVVINPAVVVAPAEGAAWAPRAQRAGGGGGGGGGADGDSNGDDAPAFFMDRPMLIPAWQGRKRNAAGELLVLVTDREAVNFGAVRPPTGEGPGSDGHGGAALAVAERNLSVVSCVSEGSTASAVAARVGRPIPDRAMYVPTDFHPGAAAAKTESLVDYEGGEPLEVRTLTGALGRLLGS